MSKEIIARKPYSAADGDQHLELVLAKIDDPNGCPYVTWGYNKQTNGYFWGHYFTNLEEALADFDKRPG